MHLDFGHEDLAFQREMRAFTTENYPAQLGEKQDEGDELAKGGLPLVAQCVGEEGLGRTNLAGRHRLGADAEVYRVRRDCERGTMTENQFSSADLHHDRCKRSTFDA